LIELTQLSASTATMNGLQSCASNSTVRGWLSIDFGELNPNQRATIQRR
jgi:hypothetical protein